ncbi:hypothetical protein BH11MYX4_BH11MYX4_15690 [soil metagenome]
MLTERIERALVVPTLHGLDALRRFVLARTAGISRPFVRSRNVRVLGRSFVACAVALVLAGYATGYLLLFGPILFGAAHLAVEARYLLFQPRRDRRVLAAVGVMAVFAVTGLGIYAVGPCILVALLLLRARDDGPSRRDKWIACFAALAIACSAVAPSWSRFLLLHLHNLLAVAVWAAWRKRPVAVSAAVTCMVSAALLCILAGGFDHAVVRTPLSDHVFSLTKITDAVAAQFHGPWRHRLLMAFAFSQSLHYAVWLRLVPEEARARETPRPWSSSWLALKEDVGARTAILCVVAVLAVPLLALLLGAVRVRSLYVTASEFHATVELLLVAMLARRTVA